MTYRSPDRPGFWVKVLSYEVYYESRKRELKTRRPIHDLIYECRCDERLKLNLRNLHVSYTLAYSGNCPEQGFNRIVVVYYESRKGDLKIRLMNEGRCDARLKARVEESTCLTYTGLHDKTN